MASDLDWLPFEAQTTLATISTCSSRASFIAGFAFFEAARFAGFGSGSGSTVWYLRCRLLAFGLAVLCVTYANTISTQFPHFRTGRSKRLFAIAVRFWSLTCFRLFIAAYFLDGLAIVFIGDTYFPTNCGSWRRTETALAQGNYSLGDPDSPCVEYFGAAFVRWAGVLAVVAYIAAFITTVVQMQPVRCCRSTIQIPVSKKYLPARVKSAKMRSGSVVTIGSTVAEQCIFISTFANSALTRALPKGLSYSDDPASPGITVYIVSTTLALICAVIGTVALSNVIVFVQAAPQGRARERFAGAATFTVRIGVALYTIALVSFLLSFATVGYGTSYRYDDNSVYVPVIVASISFVMLAVCLAKLLAVILETKRKFKPQNMDSDAVNNVGVDASASACPQIELPVRSNTGDSSTLRRRTVPPSVQAARPETPRPDDASSQSSGSSNTRSSSSSSSYGNSKNAETGTQNQSISRGSDPFLSSFGRLKTRLTAVSGNATLVVFYTFYNIVTHRVDVSDYVSGSNCSSVGGCGSLDPATPIDICFDNDTSVQCNIEVCITVVAMWPTGIHCQ